MKIVLVFILLLLQGCGQIISKRTMVCDETKIAQPEKSRSHTEEPGTEITPNKKTGDQTLLLYRMLHAI